ncbi:MAG: XdhC family protein [Burkholderiales bacterium]|nr:XdhC family protein [Phycisphaerae bacterium]
MPIADAIADSEGDGQIEVYDQISSAKATLFIETIAPPQELIVFGAGPDVVPLVDIATTLGWRITIVAAPPATHAAERLRRAHRIIVTGSEAPTAGVEIPRDAAVVVMTHNIARDRAILANLHTRPAYLGILGPTHRTERILDGLTFRIDDQSVYAPVGLDIGAQAPQEIALSIIAEITAWRTGRSGGPLRERDGPIHTAGRVPVQGVPVRRVPAGASLTRLIPSGAV